MTLDERPYVDTRLVDVAAADRAAVSAARHWSLAPPVRIRHGMNVIYRCGTVALRASTPSAPAECSLDLATTLVGAGIPVLRPARSDVVRVDGISVTAWPYLEPSGEATDWREVGRIVRRVHALDPTSLPAGLPTPSPVSFPWWDFASMLSAVAGHVDDAALDGIESTLRRHAHWRGFESTVVCHGDVHPGNVIMTDDGPVVIDWDLLCLAPVGWDHAPLMTWTERWGGEPGIYEALADGYGWSGRGDRFAEAFAELRLVAAVLMRVKAGIADPAAMPEARRRLAYFRGDPDAPVWRAQ